MNLKNEKVLFKTVSKITSRSIPLWYHGFNNFWILTDYNKYIVLMWSHTCSPNFFFLKTLKIKINWCGKRQTQWAQTYNNKWTCIGHHVDYIRGLGAFSASSHGIRPCFFKLRTESAIMRAVLRWYPPLVTIRIGMFRLRTWLNTSLSLSMIPWRCWLFILKVHVLLLRLFKIRVNIW